MSHAPGSLWQRLLARLRGLRQPRGEKRSWHAVTVAPTAHCCAAARDTLLHPILVRTLPRLPLPGCTMPQDCHCELREWPDRRIGERRLPQDDEVVADEPGRGAAGKPDAPHATDATQSVPAERRQRRERRQKP